jgi:hypothetical protein
LLIYDQMLLVDYNSARWSKDPRSQTKADTLKQPRPIGEGDQELETRLVQEELT